MKWLLFTVVVLCLTGCLLPHQQMDAVSMAVEEFVAGRLTREQFLDLVGRVIDAGLPAWLNTAIGSVIGGGLGYGAVRLRRGPPTQRVGLSADLVRPSFDDRQAEPAPRS